MHRQDSRGDGDTHTCEIGKHLNSVSIASVWNECSLRRRDDLVSGVAAEVVIDSAPTSLPLTNAPKFLAIDVRFGAFLDRLRDIVELSIRLFSFRFRRVM